MRILELSVLRNISALLKLISQRTENNSLALMPSKKLENVVVHISAAGTALDLELVLARNQSIVGCICPCRRRCYCTSSWCGKTKHWRRFEAGRLI